MGDETVALPHKFGSRASKFYKLAVANSSDVRAMWLGPTRRQAPTGTVGAHAGREEQ